MVKINGADAIFGPKSVRWNTVWHFAEWRFVNTSWSMSLSVVINAAEGNSARDKLAAIDGKVFYSFEQLLKEYNLIFSLPVLYDCIWAFSA